VAYLFKARTVEPAEQPSIANGSETTFVSRQRPRNKETTSVARQQTLNKQEQTVAVRERLGKQVPAATDTRMNGVFYAGRAEELSERQLGDQVSSVRESV
jgi:hypothetical protein